MGFSSYDAAKKMSDDFISHVGYEYNKDGVRGYAFKADELNRYRKEHQEEFDGMKSLLEDTTGVIEEWTESDEFYVFYYPCAVNGLEIMSGQADGRTWAYTVINKEGFEAVNVGPAFEPVKSEEKEIISAQEALDKIQTMYQSTILTQKIKVFDLKLQYVFTDYDVKTDEYKCSPVWKFYVLMDTGEGEMAESTVTYDAVTGELLG